MTKLNVITAHLTVPEKFVYYIVKTILMCLNFSSTGNTAQFTALPHCVLV